MRKIPKTTLSILLAAMVFSSLTIVAMAGADRQFDKDYLNASNSSDVITVTISGNGGSDFRFFMITENIPENLNVIIPIQNVSVTQNGAQYNFTGIGTNETPLVYRLKINTSLQPDIAYDISGTYKDADKIIGVITNNTLPSTIKNSTFTRYDNTPYNNRVDKAEVLNAIWDYFIPQTISLSNIISLIYKYFAGTPII